MMDLKTHTKWLNTGGSGDEDVKMLLEDLDNGTEDETTKLALSLEADASTMVMMMLLPGVNGVDPASAATLASYSEEEQQREHVYDDQESPDFNDDDDFDEELWTTASNVPFDDLIDVDEEPLALDDNGGANDDCGDDMMLLHDDGGDAEDAGVFTASTASVVGQLFGEAIAPFTETIETSSARTAGGATGPPAAVAVADAGAKKRRGRKPSLKPKKEPKKPKRPPPSPTKARLRNYERRSRTKREHTMLSMKDVVGNLETQITAFCKKQKFDSEKQQQICDMALQAITLNHQNYYLRKAIDDHRFFHSMIQLEYEHREASPISASDFSTPPSWHPLEEEACFGFIRESYQEIENFSNSEDFVSSGLEICGWREKRKLCGKSVKFQFNKRFAKDCSEDLAQRSWEMRAVQDQVTRYFGPFLNVQVEVIQRLAADVVVVRRKITHTQDNWVHHTIYLLFRTKTPDGHLVCIRDMNPEETRDMNQFVESTSPASCVIWSNCFIWWKFTTLPVTEDEPRGFEVEYGGSLSSATSADAAFWMREVLLLALRWENLVVGPLLTL